ncbi:TPA: DUF1146 family protein, partial [Listeria monocytogenes]
GYTLSNFFLDYLTASKQLINFFS